MRRIVSEMMHLDTSTRNFVTCNLWKKRGGFWLADPHIGTMHPARRAILFQSLTMTNSDMVLHLTKPPACVFGGASDVGEDVVAVRNDSDARGIPERQLMVIGMHRQWIRVDVTHPRSIQYGSNMWHLVPWWPNTMRKHKDNELSLEGMNILTANDVSTL